MKHVAKIFPDQSFKRQLTNFSIFVVSMIAVFAVCEWLYVVTLTPMVGEMYLNVSHYNHIDQRTLNSTETAQKYFPMGASKADALKTMRQEECELKKYPTHRSEISCYRQINGAPIGAGLPFLSTYKIYVILEIDGNEVRKVQSSISLGTVFDY